MNKKILENYKLYCVSADLDYNKKDSLDNYIDWTTYAIENYLLDNPNDLDIQNYKEYCKMENIEYLNTDNIDIYTDDILINISNEITLI